MGLDEDGGRDHEIAYPPLHIMALLASTSSQATHLPLVT
jgi:hypothetical protein